MKRIAALVTLANVLGYLALMQVEPRYGLLQPRGGLLTLGISFAIAWAGLLAASREDLPPERRSHLPPPRGSGCSCRASASATSTGARFRPERIPSAQPGPPNRSRHFEPPN